jgi:hypothetical protein
MRTKVFVVAAAVLVGLAVTGLPASAQTLKVDVPFAFSVEGKMAPAGAYEVEAQGDLAVKVRSMASAGTEFILPVITRLSPWNPTDSKVVFDKAGNTTVLSEVWISGQDGYLVYATKGAHSHSVVKGNKK